MVPKTLSRLHPWMGFALAGLALACQGSDLTLPTDALPASLREVSGSGQRGTVGSELPKPFVVQVTDAENRPVEQVSLRFQTQVPAAEVVPASVTTNSNGQAEVRVRLGTIEGIQTFDAQLANAADLRTTFTVIAVADEPADNGAGGGQAGGNDGNPDNGNGGGGGGGGNGGGEHRSGNGGHDDGGDNDHAGGGHGHGGHGHGGDHDDQGHGHGHGDDE